MQPLRVARRPARGRLPAPREHESAGEPGRRLPRLHRCELVHAGVQSLGGDGAAGVARVAGGAPGDGRSEAKGALTGESPGSGAFPAQPPAPHRSRGIARRQSSPGIPDGGGDPNSRIAPSAGRPRPLPASRAGADVGKPGRPPGFPAPRVGAASRFLDVPQGHVLDNLFTKIIAIARACANNRPLPSDFFPNTATAARAG